MRGSGWTYESGRNYRPTRFDHKQGEQRILDSNLAQYLQTTEVIDYQHGRFDHRFTLQAGQSVPVAPGYDRTWAKAATSSCDWG